MHITRGTVSVPKVENHWFRVLVDDKISLTIKTLLQIKSKVAVFYLLVCANDQNEKNQLNLETLELFV